MNPFEAGWEEFFKGRRLRMRWRLGYGKKEALAGYGWRRLFWRLWWLDLRLRDDLLAAVGLQHGLVRGELESGEHFYKRIANAAHERFGRHLGQ